MIFVKEPVSDLIKEKHPYGEFIEGNPKLLFVGSFPSKATDTSMNFFYHNPTNNMWKIMGDIFYNDPEHFVVDSPKRTFNEQKIKNFLIEKHIGICDSILSAYRAKGNSSDNNLIVEIPNDIIKIQNILKNIPNCKAIAFTGEDALKPLLHQLGLNKVLQIGVEYKDKIKIENREFNVYRMPTPSLRGGAKWSYIEKKHQYQMLFCENGIQ